MQTRRVLSLFVVLAWVASFAPALLAQNNQPKRTKQEQQDIEALQKLLDGVAAGTTPAPTEIPVTWQHNIFVAAAEGATYVPFTVRVDRSALSSPGVALYVRAVSKDAAAAPAPEQGNNRDRNNRNNQQEFPWQQVYFLDVPANGVIERPLALKPGNYDVFVAVKERTPERQQRNAPPLKSGVVRHELSVPNFGPGSDLTTSTVMTATTIEPLSAPLTQEQQTDEPYLSAFGARLVQPEDGKFKKTGDFNVFFWIYGAGQEGGKPNLTIEYSFHQKTAEGEKYFNKTTPQEVNAQTLPPAFDMNQGHQIPGSTGVPLASFPEGDYRLEIKITDKTSGKTLTQNANFTVVAG